MIPTPSKRDGDADVLLMCLPWQAVSRGNLGLALISALVGEVAAVRSLFVNLRFARQIGQDMYERVQATRFTAEALFTPAAFKLEGERFEAWLRRAAPVMQEEAGLTASQVEKLAAEEVPALVAAVADEVAQLRPAVVGTSLLVSQVVPSVAVASAIKAIAPGIPILAGGSGSFGSMGTALLRSFGAFDVCVTGEVAGSVVPLVRRLGDGGNLDDIPGIAFRGPDDLVRVNPGTRPDRLDDLPMPDYDDYVAQYREAGLAGDIWLPFESSRGCWWGERSICSFCGLNAENVAYRRKTPARVGAELAWLNARYGAERFCATDNILASEAAEDLLPELARLRQRVPGLRIYYQMKSNVTRPLLARLVDAGVTIVQPGIESFSDHILRLMRKGATGLSQVRAIKLMTEAGLDVVYGLLYGTFGETAADLREQAELLPALQHLIPPSYCSPISLDRFSPYAEAPADYGIELLPPAHSELIFPDAGVDQLGIAGAFTISRTGPAEPDPDVIAAAGELRTAVARWQESYRPGLCSSAQLPGPIVHVTDQRAGHLRQYRLDGDRARVLLGCDRETSLRRLASREQLSGPAIDAAAAWLARHQLIVRRGDLAIALPTRTPRPLVVGLTGLPCAGKSSFAQAALKLGVPCIDVGELIRQKFGDAAYDLTPTDKVELLGKSDSVFRALGPELREICRDRDLVLIDSFKAASDLAVVREEVADAMVESLLITAGRELRRSRFVSRARPDDGPSLQDKEDKLAPIGIESAAREAAWTIENAGTDAEYEQQVTDFLAQLRTQPAGPDR
jgi:ribosomal peptide maturation radical SAM protein 1